MWPSGVQGTAGQMSLQQPQLSQQDPKRSCKHVLSKVCGSRQEVKQMLHFSRLEKHGQLLSHPTELWIYKTCCSTLRWEKDRVLCLFLFKPKPWVRWTEIVSKPTVQVFALFPWDSGDQVKVPAPVWEMLNEKCWPTSRQKDFQQWLWQKKKRDLLMERQTQWGWDAAVLWSKHFSCLATEFKGKRMRLRSKMQHNFCCYFTDCCSYSSKLETEKGAGTSDQWFQWRTDNIFQRKVGRYEMDLGFGSLRRQVLVLKTLKQGSFSSETNIIPCVV